MKLLSLDPAKIVALTKSLMDAKITYGLGSKISPISLQATDLAARGIHSVDCSGFVRWAIWHATGSLVAMPDGSVQQHGWIDDRGLPKVAPSAAHADDGSIFIAFLTPEDGGGVGHVMLITGGLTCESHGHHGPDRRLWGSEAWMGECAVYRIAGAAQ